MILLVCLFLCLVLGGRAFHRQVAAFFEDVRFLLFGVPARATLPADPGENPRPGVRRPGAGRSPPLSAYGRRRRG